MIKERFIALVERYLSGTATDTDQQLIKEYMARLEANENTPVDTRQEQKIKEAMWQQIQGRTTLQSEVVQIHWYQNKIVRLIGVAASIILAIGLGLLFFTNNKSQQSLVARNDSSIDSTKSIAYHEVNTTGKEKRIQLQDGSLIVLSNKSEITYRQPFTNARDISLIGKAFFKVAKDKTRPFTVTSGDISTTALGTEFTVTAFKNSKKIVVRLYEGKVVIKAMHKGNKKLKSDIYLLPGQAFVYDVKTPGKVKTFKVKDTQIPEDVLKMEEEGEDPSVPQNTQGSWYMFNNEPVAEVFVQLEQMFNVKIEFNEADFQNTYFTRRYNRSASLETILSEIATLNNLKISKKDSAFIISK